MPDIPRSRDMDDEILTRLLHGDPAAWTTLIRDYSGLLIAVANRTFASYGYKPVTQDAEDVVAVVWSNVLANDHQIIRRCLKQGHWLATLYTLVRNRAIDVMRAHRLATVPLDETLIPEPEPASEPEPPAIPPAHLRQAMRSLNARERTLVELFFLQGKKYREIAALTGVAQNSIGPTLGRALSKLRTALTT
jgi:RNA polymerase sigma factor (sigma-70 family)